MTPEQKLIAELIPLAGEAIELARQCDEASADELLLRLDNLASSHEAIRAIVEYTYVSEL